MRGLSIYQAVRSSFARVLDNFYLYGFGTVKIALIGFLSASIVVSVAFLFDIELVKQIVTQAPLLTKETAQSFFTEQAYRHSLWIGITTVILGLLASWVILLYWRFIMNAHDQGTGSVRQALSEVKIYHVARMFVATFLFLIIMLIISLVGIFFLMIPTIYISIRLEQYPYLILDKNAGIIEAFQGSWDLTRGNVWALLGVVMFSSLFLHADILLLLFYPLWSLINIDVYKQLLKARN